MRNAQQVFTNMARPTGRPDARSPRRTRRASRCSGAGPSEARSAGHAGAACGRMRFSSLGSTGGARCGRR
jgi:hypothetical protein